MNSSPNSPCRKDSSATLTPAFVKHCSSDNGSHETSTTKCCGLSHISRCFNFSRINKELRKKSCFGEGSDGNFFNYCDKYIDRSGVTRAEEEEDNKIIYTCDDIQKQITDPYNYRYFNNFI